MYKNAKSLQHPVFPTGWMFVHTTQPVVQPVVKPVEEHVVCLHDVNGWMSGCTNQTGWIHAAGWTTGWTTGWMFVYTIQPVVQPVIQPVGQPVIQPVGQPIVLCKRGIKKSGKSTKSWIHSTKPYRACADLRRTL